MGKTFSTGLLTDGIAQDSSNNIGIGGAVNASYKLTVTGTTLTTGAATFSSSVQATTMSIGIAPQTDKLFVYNASGTNTGLTIQQDGTGDIFRANGNSGANRFVVQQGGNVGIGISSPFSLLSLPSGTGWNGGLAWNYTSANSSSKKWWINTDQIVYGDFRICTEITQGGGSINNASTLYERLYINPSGNVGIGSTNPTARLDINNTSGDANLYLGSPTGNGSYIRLINNSVQKWFIGTNATGAPDNDLAIYGYGGQNGNIISYTNGAERMRITSGGKLLVGATTTIFSSSGNNITSSVSAGGEAVLEVSNNSSTDSSPSINCFKTSATTSSAARFIQFYSQNGSIAMGGIVGNGSTNVQFASISDIREKENITPINGSLDKILSLNPVEYDWIKTKEHIKAGFVAQEVEQIFPEYVVENMSNDGEEERKGLTGGMSSGIIAHLVKAIQEQQEIINQLSAKVTALENR